MCYIYQQCYKSHATDYALVNSVSDHKFHIYLHLQVGDIYLHVQPTVLH